MELLQRIILLLLGYNIIIYVHIETVIEIGRVLGYEPELLLGIMDMYVIIVWRVLGML